MAVSITKPVYVAIVAGGGGGSGMGAGIRRQLRSDAVILHIQ